MTWLRTVFHLSSRWVSGLLTQSGLLEKMCIQTPHICLSSQPPFTFLTPVRSCLCTHEVPQRGFSAPSLQNLPFATYYRCFKGSVQARIPRKVGVKPRTLSMPNGNATRKGCTSWQKFREAFNFRWIGIFKGESASSEHSALALTWRYTTMVWFARNSSTKCADLAGLFAWKVTWKICANIITDEMMC